MNKAGKETSIGNVTFQSVTCTTSYGDPEFPPEVDETLWLSGGWQFSIYK